MDFGLTTEQSMLRDTVASYLADNYDFETRRRVASSDPGWRPDVWKAFAQDLGILGATFPEAMGGLGGGAVETMLIMEQFGKALVIEPFVETVVVGGSLLKADGGAAATDMIGKIIEGEAIFGLAIAEHQARYTWWDLLTSARARGNGYVLNGSKAVAVGAPMANHLIVTARTGGGQRDREGVSLFLVDKSAKGVSTRDYPTVDGRRASEVTFENVELPAEALIGPKDHGLPLFLKALDEAIVAVCAEATGVLRQLHDGTVDYTKQRKQFGVPISTFQVLQHRMVDMFIQVEQSVSMATMAAMMLGESDTERAKAAAAAKVQIGKACKFVGHGAIQLHGGMGMTDELAISHFFKRAIMIESQFGNTDHHLARYEKLAL
jgi:alkylation response protein AidB-like acyl-CoA dehydrogenase